MIGRCVTLLGMGRPLFVRSMAEDKRKQLEAGLRSTDPRVLRRCQILLASSRGQHQPATAQVVRCDDETVREVIHTPNERGLQALQRKSSRPHRT